MEKAAKIPSEVLDVDHRAGVDADPHLELHAVLRQPLVDVRHGELHGQPARDRLGRVVVTGDGGSENDEDRVADEIVDGALVAAVAGEAAAGSISPTIEST
jgi:hypothetical protein